ncbi:MAG: isoprenylcysteine carboxylmethyltransferase family protein [Spirochaetes bacterium]|nr:isoprenylcysteine carboxylmethyltransferase family protein [Spirochaetota bacterium]
MKKYGSLILPMILIVLVVFCVFMRLNGEGSIPAGSRIDLEIIVMLIYLLWLFREMKVFRPDLHHEKKSSDYGTRELYGVGQALTVLSALWLAPPYVRHGMAHWAGALLFLAGILFRTWAIETLGDYYSHAVSVMNDHRIITTGPYRFMRHPAYAGMLAAHGGIVVFFFNYVTLAIYLLLFIPAIVVRILIEEKTLMKIEGYAEFARDRKRLIPGLW